MIDLHIVAANDARLVHRHGRDGSMRSASRIDGDNRMRPIHDREIGRFRRVGHIDHAFPARLGFFQALLREHQRTGNHTPIDGYADSQGRIPLPREEIGPR